MEIPGAFRHFNFQLTYPVFVGSEPGDSFFSTLILHLKVANESVKKWQENGSFNVIA